MFARISNGWALMKESFGVLRSDKELLVFPLISGIACLIVAASFAVPIFFSSQFQEMVHGNVPPQYKILGYVLMFLFYVITYFIIVFFNVALVSCALKRMSGGDPTVSYGMQEAVGRLPQIAA